MDGTKSGSEHAVPPPPSSTEIFFTKTLLERVNRPTPGNFYALGGDKERVGWLLVSQDDEGFQLVGMDTGPQEDRFTYVCRNPLAFAEIWYVRFRVRIHLRALPTCRYDGCLAERDLKDIQRKIRIRDIHRKAGTVREYSQQELRLLSIGGGLQRMYNEELQRSSDLF